MEIIKKNVCVISEKYYKMEAILIIGRTEFNLGKSIKST